MTSGSITNALMLAVGDAWGNSLTFSFWDGFTDDLVNEYLWVNTGHSAQPGGSEPSYLSVYDPTGLESADRNLARWALTFGAASFASVSFTEVQENGDLKLGSLSYNVSTGNGYVLAWVTHIGFADTPNAGDVWFTQAGQTGGLTDAGSQNASISTWDIPHELGHLLGLAHPHDVADQYLNLFGILNYKFDNFPKLNYGDSLLNPQTPCPMPHISLP